MEELEQILLIMLSFFLIKLHSGTQFVSHLSEHLRTCFNHPNHKKITTILIKKYVSI
jgi:hypothetical protein